MCTLCCSRVDESNCRPANETSQCREHEENCKAYNDSICSLQYSDPEQALFCEVQDPVIWPAVLDIPAEYQRPGRWRPDVVMFTTADNPDVQRALTRRLLPELDPDASLDSEQIGEVVSMNGVVFGSSEAPDLVNYIEPAFVNDGLAMIARNCSNNTTQLMLQRVNFGLRFALSQFRLIDPTSANVTAEMVSCVDIHFQSNSSDEIDQYIYCNYREARCNTTATVFGVEYDYPEFGSPDQYTQAVDFRGTNRMTLEADFWIKDWNFDGDSDGDANQQRASQPINMIANAWLQYATGHENDRSLILGIHELPKPTTRLNLELSSIVAVLLFTWVLQLLLPLMLVQLVYEKEANLRIMMRMHGLSNGAYWLVNYCYYLIIYVLYIAVFVSVGSAAGFAIFTRNSYGVQFAFLLLFGNVQIAFSFVLSNFFRSSRGCVVFSFLWIFGTGFIGSFLLTTLFNRDKEYNYLIELVPAFAAYRGLYELGEYGFRASYSNSQGITWSKFDEDKNHMGYILIVLLLEWPFLLALAWYLEQVLTTATGISKHPLFFLDYFRNRKVSRVLSHGQGSAAVPLKDHEPNELRSSRSIVNMELDKETNDEATERRRVECFTEAEAAEHSIIVNQLRKVYPAYTNTPAKVAVKGLTMAIQKGEVFGLLGPNGAGKTTAINMLIGFVSPSSGTALVEGCDIRRDMQTLYGLMGVCPQHDLLWETLTGYEHLLFYGRLKGLRNQTLHESAETALKAVNLFHGHVGNKLVKGYSGGMKRRLSVAISLIGNPRVVYLDEPSTGLDPASRRNLWEVVKSAKQDKAIILTTHNMEEAEELCDRLGIFVDGKLQVIGNPKSLTARYGGYLVFTLITIPERVTQAANSVRASFPNSTQIYSLAGTLKFELPSQEVTLSSVFHLMENLSQTIKILDWGVASVTLEEVFIKIAKEAGAKSIELS
eukprot:g8069.t1